MKYASIIAISSLMATTAFCQSADVQYTNHFKFGLNESSYEYRAPDDVYVEVTGRYNPDIKTYGGSILLGHSMKMNGPRTLTPFGGIIILDKNGTTNGWPMLGIKANEDLTEVVSVGLSLFTAIGTSKNLATSCVFDAPLTFHLGSLRNYDIEVKPFIGMNFCNSKHNQFNGVSLKAGYRF